MDAVASPFLEEGLALGLRVELITDGPADAALARLAHAFDAEAARARGALTVRSSSDVYGGGEDVVDPRAQAAVYRAVTEQALADGFEGYRVAADCTALCVTPAQRAAFARYEHLADRMMARRPMSAMCLFDRGRLGPEAVAQLACVHPAHDAEETPFALFGTPDGIGLVGEVDLLSVSAFRQALAYVEGPRGTPLDVDASALTFIDHHGLLALDAAAAREERTVVLRGGSTTAARLVALLSLDRVEVVA